MENSALVGARIINVLPEVAEIPGTFGRRRDSVPKATTDMAPLPLIIAKCEQLILFDGSADGTSELIPVAARNAFRLSKWIAGEIGIGALEIEGRAVDLVGPRFGLSGYNWFHSCPKLWMLYMLINLSFHDRVE